MRGDVRRFLGAATRHRGRRTHELTQEQVDACNSLRDEAAISGLTDAELALAACCTRSTIRGWLDRQRYLSPRQQSGVRQRLWGHA
jgi:hypothetical protein